MNEYESNREIIYYPSEGRIEEFSISADTIAPRQESRLTLVVKEFDYNQIIRKYIEQ
jgi:hypothetical protein